MRLENVTVALSLKDLLAALAVGATATWAVMSYRLQPIEKGMGELKACMDKGHSEMKQEMRELKAGMSKLGLATAGMAGVVGCAVLFSLAGR